jgi:hypothetical protein
MENKQKKDVRNNYATSWYFFFFFFCNKLRASCLLGALPLELLSQPFFVLGILKIGSHELFAQASHGILKNKKKSTLGGTTHAGENTGAGVLTLCSGYVRNPGESILYTQESTCLYSLPVILQRSIQFSIVILRE